ncbi:hypothetical protein LXL04_039981 [Taraxacum kok-saghyz]
MYGLGLSIMIFLRIRILDRPTYFYYVNINHYCWNYGFWFTRPVAAKACQKAFVTNRVGDFGLLLGILGFYWITGSFEFRDLFHILNNLISNNEVRLRNLHNFPFMYGYLMQWKGQLLFGPNTCCYDGSSGNFSCSSTYASFHSHTPHNEFYLFDRDNNSFFRSYFSSCSKRH